MTEHVTSGCGPGLSRPTNTPQEGVRSVLPRDRADYLARLNIAMDDVLARWVAIDHGKSDLVGLAVELQKAADLARKIAGWK